MEVNLSKIMELFVLFLKYFNKSSILIKILFREFKIKIELVFFFFLRWHNFDFFQILRFKNSVRKLNEDNRKSFVRIFLLKNEFKFKGGLLKNCIVNPYKRMTNNYYGLFQ